MKKYLLAALVLFVFMLFIPILACLGDNAPGITGNQSASSGAASSSAQKISSPADGDTFTLLDESSGNLLQVSARDYLLGNVASEMPPSFHSEALKAQAAASYTYAYRQREQQKAKPDETLKGAHLRVNVAEKTGYIPRDKAQEQWGTQFDASWKRIEEAVDQVLGKIIVYGGEPVLAVYHAMSAGTTETAQVYWGSDVPYLQSTNSPGDPLAPQNTAEVTIPAADMQTKLTSSIPGVSLGEDKASWFGEIKKSAAGTVETVQVGGQPVTGRDLRTALGLRSANFEIACKDDAFVVTSHGYGHGVGLSQYGADYMARQGSKWQDILRHYYKNVEIVTAPGYGQS